MNFGDANEISDAKLCVVFLNTGCMTIKQYLFKVAPNSDFFKEV